MTTTEAILNGDDRNFTINFVAALTVAYSVLGLEGGGYVILGDESGGGVG